MEKKIEALPSLSLEEFQEKKKQQRTKKKKILQKFNSLANKKHQNNSSNQTNNQTQRVNTISESYEESEKAHLVGSQKRKARKQSITRNAAAINSIKHSEDQEQDKCKL